MRKSKSQHRRTYSINVKIVDLLVDLIDANLANGKALQAQGFHSRVHFVETAVAEKLLKLNLLDQNKVAGLDDRRKHMRKSRTKK